MAKIIVDRQTFQNKDKALREFEMAMRMCDGSEQSRMCFAYLSILDGCTIINTYKETAE